MVFMEQNVDYQVNFPAEYVEKICAASQEMKSRIFWKNALESPSILAWIVDQSGTPVQFLPQKR